MILKDYIIEKIKSLPGEALQDLNDFIDSLEARMKGIPLKEEAGKEFDPLSQVIGICEGPSDLAERHDKYIYGIK
jgi:hypothetical protein